MLYTAWRARRIRYEEFNDSLISEIRDTASYVVEHDLPMSEVFTSNSTFRDRNAELVRRRYQVSSTQNPDVVAALRGMQSWPEGGKWAPRDEETPGQHAGVLTSPQLLHWLPDRRQRQLVYAPSPVEL